MRQLLLAVMFVILSTQAFATSSVITAVQEGGLAQSIAGTTNASVNTSTGTNITDAPAQDEPTEPAALTGKASAPPRPMPTPPPATPEEAAAIEASRRPLPDQIAIAQEEPGRPGYWFLMAVGLALVLAALLLVTWLRKRKKSFGF